MRPGDIIFFSALDITDVFSREFWESWVTALGPVMGGNPPTTYKHVAVSLGGPLIIHATIDKILGPPPSYIPVANPKGRNGVELKLLAGQFKAGKKYKIFRHNASDEPDFQRQLETASLHWLGEKYAQELLIPTILAPIRECLRQRLGRADTSLPSPHLSDEQRHAGSSFCSLLVQKIYARLEIAPLASETRLLLPVHLHEVLRSHSDWQMIEAENLYQSSTEEGRGNQEYSSKGEKEQALLDTLISYAFKKDDLQRRVSTSLTEGLGYLHEKGLKKVEKVAEGIARSIKMRESFLGEEATTKERQEAVRLVTELTGMAYRSLPLLPDNSMIDMLCSPFCGELDVPPTSNWLLDKYGVLIQNHKELQNTVSDTLSKEAKSVATIVKLTQLEKFFIDDVQSNEQNKESIRRTTILKRCRLVLSWMDIHTDAELKTSVERLNCHVGRLTECEIPDWQDHRKLVSTTCEFKIIFLTTIQSILSMSGVSLEELPLDDLAFLR